MPPKYLAPMALSNQVRQQWHNFEEWLVGPQKAMEERCQEIMKDMDKEWRAKPSKQRPRQKDHEASKQRVKRELRGELVLMAREEWQRRLDEVGLRNEDWFDITPEEQAMVERALGSDEDDAADNTQPPAQSRLTVTKAVQPQSVTAPPPLSNSMRSQNSSYAIVNPASFKPEETGGYDDEESYSPFSDLAFVYEVVKHENRDDSSSPLSGWSTDLTQSTQTSHASSPEHPVSRSMPGEFWPSTWGEAPAAPNAKSSKPRVATPASALFQPAQSPPSNARNQLFSDPSATIRISTKEKESLMERSSKSRVAGPHYIGPQLTSPDELSSEEADFEEFKMETRIAKIHEFHREAAVANENLVRELFLYRRMKALTADEEAQKIAEHEKKMANLLRVKEEERRTIVGNERQKRREVIRRKSTALKEPASSGSPPVNSLAAAAAKIKPTVSGDNITSTSPLSNMPSLPGKTERSLEAIMEAQAKMAKQFDGWPSGLRSAKPANPKPSEGSNPKTAGTDKKKELLTQLEPQSSTDEYKAPVKSTSAWKLPTKTSVPLSQSLKVETPVAAPPPVPVIVIDQETSHAKPAKVASSQAEDESNAATSEATAAAAKVASSKTTKKQKGKKNGKSAPSQTASSTSVADVAVSSSDFPPHKQAQIASEPATTQAATTSQAKKSAEHIPASTDAKPKPEITAPVSNKMTSSIVKDAIPIPIKSLKKTSQVTETATPGATSSRTTLEQMQVPASVSSSHLSPPNQDNREFWMPKSAISRSTSDQPSLDARHPPKLDSQPTIVRSTSDQPSSKKSTNKPDLHEIWIPPQPKAAPPKQASYLSTPLRSDKQPPTLVESKKSAKAAGKAKVTMEEVSDDEAPWSSSKQYDRNDHPVNGNVILEPKPVVPAPMFNQIFEYDEKELNEPNPSVYVPDLMQMDQPQRNSTGWDALGQPEAKATKAKHVRWTPSALANGNPLSTAGGNGDSSAAVLESIFEDAQSSLMSGRPFGGRSRASSLAQSSEGTPMADRKSMGRAKTIRQDGGDELSWYAMEAMESLKQMRSKPASAV